jgi:hypothetical protein
MSDDQEPTITVSLARKINTGNYTSADVFVSLSGLKAGMTPADIEPLLVVGKFAWEAAREALLEQIKIARKGKEDA